MEEVGGLPLDAETREAVAALNRPQVKIEVDLMEKEKNQGIKVIATDRRGKILKFVFEWTDEVKERILRVFAGFMRDKVQVRVEILALEKRKLTIDLEIVEAGVEIGKEMMAEMIGGAIGKVAGDIASKAAKMIGLNELNEVGILQHVNKLRSELRGD